MSYNPYYTEQGQGGNSYNPKYKEMYQQLYGDNAGSGVIPSEDNGYGAYQSEGQYGSAAAGTGGSEQLVGGGFANAPKSAPSTGGQANVGGIISAASGIASQVGSDLSAVQQARQTNFRAPAGGEDAYGRPIYNLGQLGNDLRGYKVDYDVATNLGRHLTKTTSAAGSGFAAGGWIGAAVAAAASSASDWWQQNTSRNIRRRKRHEGEQRLAAGQQNYNLREQMWRDQQGAQDYYNQMQSQYGQRVQNLYGGNV